MLSLYKLQIFVRVADEGSMTGAAEVLFMAQASVSQHIKELEASLGVSLFVRGRGVQLTEKGQQLYTHAEQMLQLAAQIESEITDVRNLEAGRLALCGTPGMTTFFFPDWLQRFRRDYAYVEVSLSTGTTPQVEDWVQRRVCDVGFAEGLPAQTSGVQASAIATVPQYVVVGPQHPWWGSASIELEQMNGQALITRQPNSQSRIWLEEVLTENEIVVDVVAAFDAIEPIKRSVSMSERCFSVLPQYAVETELESKQLWVIPVTDIPLHRHLWLVQHSNLPLSPFAQAFLRIVEPARL